MKDNIEIEYIFIYEPFKLTLVEYQGDPGDIPLINKDLLSIDDVYKNSRSYVMYSCCKCIIKSIYGIMEPLDDNIQEKLNNLYEVLSTTEINNIIYLITNKRNIFYANMNPSCTSISIVDIEKYLLLGAL